MHVVRRRVLLQLDFAAVNRPEAQFLLLLPRRRGFLHIFLSGEIGRLFLGESINLLARFAEKCLRNGAIVVQKNLMDDSE